MVAGPPARQQDAVSQVCGAYLKWGMLRSRCAATLAPNYKVRRRCGPMAPEGAMVAKPDGLLLPGPAALAEASRYCVGSGFRVRHVFFR
jgi:hypothetical protein